MLVKNDANILQNMYNRYEALRFHLSLRSPIDPMPASILAPLQRRVTRLLVALPLLASLGSVGLAANPAHAQTMSSGDIVDTAVAAGNFTTLATALNAAGLVDTLKGPGPFTVFAPTDAAFAKLPAGTVDSLLANPDQLRTVLTYHVVPGKVTAADVVKLHSATTVEGEDVTVNAADGMVSINDAMVTTPDIMASNGVIHVIDSVLMPPSMSRAPMATTDIVDTALDAGNFNTLAAALQAAGLVDTLKGPGPFTVFAPTDAAFAKLPAGTLDNLLANPDQLRAVLTYHVVAGADSAADVSHLQQAPTIQGEDVLIQATDGMVQINDATVTQADIMASNGIIHVIDSVLLPPSLAASLATQ
jgi:transforming growth factor-beta-induced protein